MSCNNKVEVYRYADQMEFGCNFNGHGVTMVPCSTTGPKGKVVQCDECATKERERYPQGWRNVPGDICKHGVYTGDPYGPDIMCGHCEDGDSETPTQETDSNEC